MDPPFDQAYFKSFDLVLNALDNLSARRHVNKMCVMTKVPLIESGTAGYNGQVQPIRSVSSGSPFSSFSRPDFEVDQKGFYLPRLVSFFSYYILFSQGKMECYDCQPKPLPKTFPVCTIRSTPSSPIHCIVWAKNYLFPWVLPFIQPEKWMCSP